MNIDLTFDSSVKSSPFAAQIEATAKGVAKFYETQFNNPITITIDVGWGEVDGQSIPAFGGAESMSNFAGSYAYAQVRAAFAADATTADDRTALASLPLADPLPDADTFYATTAEAKALGLSLAGAASGPDGWAGLNSSSTWVFNTTNTNGSDVPNGDLDAFSFLAHEFSEIMGRQMNFAPGDPANFGGGYYPYDLFDYTAKGVRSVTSTVADRYFSIDGGATNTGLHYFNNDPSEGDAFDWLPNGTTGSYEPSGVANSYDFEGSVGAVSASDLRLMDVLGYDPTPNFTASNLANAGAKFSFAVHDVSEGAAAASSARVYLSATSKITTADTVLATVATATIAAGGTVSDSAVLALSKTLAAGTYYVGAIADYNGAVAEPETANGVSNALPILVVAASNIGSISGVASADAFLPGHLTQASALTLDGSLTVTGTLTEAASIGGTGTLFLAGGTNFVAAAAGATLSGGGTVAMADVKAAITGASSAARLTNVNDTIAGAGYIGLGSLTLHNEASGVIDASVAGDLAINTSGATLINAGLMESTLAGALLVLNATTIANAGGTIAAAGGVVDLQNAAVIGGALAGSKAINVNSGSSTLDEVALDATVQVLSGTTLTAEGTLTGTGALSLFGGGKVIVASTGLTLTGGGHIDTNDVATNAVVGATATAALTNVSDHLSLAGKLGGGTMVLTNGAAGTILDSQSAALTIDTGTKAIANAGLIESDGSGGVVIASAIVNSGTLMAAQGALSLDGEVSGSGTGRISGGTLDATAASKFAENVTFVTGATGTLELGDSQAYAGAVTGFSKTGTTALDLADIAFKSGTTKASYAGTTASGVLTVTDGTHTAKITLEGDYLTSTFTLSADGQGGTKVVDPAQTAAALRPFIDAAASFGAAKGGGLDMAADGAVRANDYGSSLASHPA